MNKQPFLIKISVIVLLVFNTISGFAGIEKKAITTVINQVPADSIIISGTIKDEDGKPLQNAAVIFDSATLATTDKDGKFSFTPAAITATSHSIYFTYDGLATVVRTYYPAMQSAKFDIVLRQQITTKKTATTVSNNAIIKEPLKQENTIVAVDNTVKETTAITNTQVSSTDVELDFPSILFKANATALNSENKSFLDIISSKLKNNPSAKIDIRAYTQEHNHNPQIAQKRLSNVFNYLIQKGIAPARLNKVTEVGGGEENTVDLVKAAQ